MLLEKLLAIQDIKLKTFPREIGGFLMEMKRLLMKPNYEN